MWVAIVVVKTDLSLLLSGDLATTLGDGAGLLDVKEVVGLVGLLVDELAPSEWRVVGVSNTTIIITGHILIKPIPLTLQPRRLLLLHRLILKTLNYTLHINQPLTQVTRYPLQLILINRHLNLPRLPILLKVLVKLLQRLLIISLVNSVVSDERT